MRVLNVPFGADTGGVSYQLAKAFENVPGIEFRSLISSLNYLDYPTDHEYTIALLREWWEWADVIHLHHSAGRARSMMKRFRLPGKPAVIHFHGTGFREHPDMYLREARRFGALPLVASLDLWMLDPSDTVRWAPAPIMPLEGHRKLHTTPGMLVGHAPTNRQIKGTQAVIEACAQIPEVELELIERVPWQECLTRKGRVDVYVDQFRLGYGMNALEAWSMGIPVIAGARNDILRTMGTVFGQGCLPFYTTREEHLLPALNAFLLSPDLRAEYAQLGREFIDRYHRDGSVFLESYQEVRDA